MVDGGIPGSIRLLLKIVVLYCHYHCSIIVLYKYHSYILDYHRLAIGNIGYIVGQQAYTIRVVKRLPLCLRNPTCLSWGVHITTANRLLSLGDSSVAKEGSPEVLIGL